MRVTFTGTPVKGLVPGQFGIQGALLPAVGAGRSSSSREPLPLTGAPPEAEQLTVAHDRVEQRVVGVAARGQGDAVDVEHELVLL